MSTWQTRKRCDQTAAWQTIQSYFDSNEVPWILDKVLKNAEKRVKNLSFSAPHVFADLSKQLWDENLLAQLLSMAEECDLGLHRAAMFAGEAINNTEGRAVMHWLLRAPKDAQAANAFVVQAAGQVHETLDAALAFASQVRANPQITDVVNIGIGGSDLGPLMVGQALQNDCTTGQRMHFVSNVDGQHLASVLRTCKPQNTLFLVASKTFTTNETMQNAASAKAWFLGGGGIDTQTHFAALTTNVAAANSFGIKHCFGFWDWVGGRYSLWSAIGLSIAIAIGADNFKALLQGAHEMDAHFQNAPFQANLPVVLGLLDVLNRNFHGFSSRSVAPYSQALARLPAYLQQLEMESNGKRVDAQGQTLPFHTSPVVWGEPGTNGQHAYFQMLHQGTDVVPVEFVAVQKPSHGLPGHHSKLLANAVAQAQALMLGQADAGGHRHFPGNRPSSFLVLGELNPTSLGALIALYEHRVFVAGSLWGINSFDQYGVELGKVLAADIEPRLAAGGGQALGDLDASTAALIERFRV